jgi:hypothetical protein
MDVTYLSGFANSWQKEVLKISATTMVFIHSKIFMQK